VPPPRPRGRAPPAAARAQVKENRELRDALGEAGEALEEARRREDSVLNQHRAATAALKGEVASAHRGREAAEADRREVAAVRESLLAELAEKDAACRELADQLRSMERAAEALQGEVEDERAQRLLAVEQCARLQGLLEGKEDQLDEMRESVVPLADAVRATVSEQSERGAAGLEQVVRAVQDLVQTSLRGGGAERAGGSPLQRLGTLGRAASLRAGADDWRGAATSSLDASLADSERGRAAAEVEASGLRAQVAALEEKLRVERERGSLLEGQVRSSQGGDRSFSRSPSRLRSSAPGVGWSVAIAEASRLLRGGQEAPSRRGSGVGLGPGPDAGAPGAANDEAEAEDASPRPKPPPADAAPRAPPADAADDDVRHLLKQLGAREKELDDARGEAAALRDRAAELEARLSEAEARQTALEAAGAEGGVDPAEHLALRAEAKELAGLLDKAHADLAGERAEAEEALRVAGDLRAAGAELRVRAETAEAAADGLQQAVASLEGQVHVLSATAGELRARGSGDAARIRSLEEALKREQVRAAEATARKLALERAVDIVRGVPDQMLADYRRLESRHRELELDHAAARDRHVRAVDTVVARLAAERGAALLARAFASWRRASGPRPRRGDPARRSSDAAPHLDATTTGSRARYVPSPSVVALIERVGDLERSLDSERARSGALTERAARAEAAAALLEGRAHSVARKMAGRVRDFRRLAGVWRVLCTWMRRCRDASKRDAAAARAREEAAEAEAARVVDELRAVPADVAGLLRDVETLGAEDAQRRVFQWAKRAELRAAELTARCNGVVAAGGYLLRRNLLRAAMARWRAAARGGRARPTRGAGGAAPARPALTGAKAVEGVARLPRTSVSPTRLAHRLAAHAENDEAELALPPTKPRATADAAVQAGGEDVEPLVGPRLPAAVAVEDAIGQLAKSDVTELRGKLHDEVLALRHVLGRYGDMLGFGDHSQSSAVPRAPATSGVAGGGHGAPAAGPGGSRILASPRKGARPASLARRLERLGQMSAALELSTSHMKQWLGTSRELGSLHFVPRAAEEEHEALEADVRRTERLVAE